MLSLGMMFSALSAILAGSLLVDMSLASPILLSTLFAKLVSFLGCSGMGLSSSTDAVTVNMIAHQCNQDCFLTCLLL